MGHFIISGVDTIQCTGLQESMKIHLGIPLTVLGVKVRDGGIVDWKVAASLVTLFFQNAEHVRTGL